MVYSPSPSSVFCFNVPSTPTPTRIGTTVQVAKVATATGTSRHPEVVEPLVAAVETSPMGASLAERVQAKNLEVTDDTVPDQLSATRASPQHLSLPLAEVLVVLVQVEQRLEAVATTAVEVGHRLTDPSDEIIRARFDQLRREDLQVQASKDVNV